MGLQIWIPESAREPAKKVFRCNICQRRFPEEQRQQWARHVRACDRKNPEVMEAQLAARESNTFQSVQDKEQFTWLRKRAFDRKEPGFK